MPFPPPVPELTILLHRVTLLLAMTSCVASSTPRPCILSWCPPLSLQSSVFPVPIYIYIYIYIHTHTHISCARSILKPTIPLSLHQPTFNNFSLYMTFVLFLYWHGFCCLLRASTALILCCISLDMLLSHSLPAFVWLSLPPCISATVWTKLWNTEFYWYWSLSRVLTCREHPRSLEIPDCTQCAFKFLHKSYRRNTLWLKIISLFTLISFHRLHLSLLFSSRKYHTLGDLAGSVGWRINSTKIRSLGFRV